MSEKSHKPFRKFWHLELIWGKIISVASKIPGVLHDWGMLQRMGWAWIRGLGDKQFWEATTSSSPSSSVEWNTLLYTFQALRLHLHQFKYVQKWYVCIIFALVIDLPRGQKLLAYCGNPPQERNTWFEVLTHLETDVGATTMVKGHAKGNSSSVQMGAT